jgi:uncharacterized radical SAM superfamily Fe-S cluster-containing enzyme
MKVATIYLNNKDTSKLLPCFKYLEMIRRFDQLKCKATTIEDFMSIDQVNEAIQVQTCYRLKQIIDQRKESKATKKDFINSLKALDIVKVAQDHIKLMSIILFKSITTPNEDFKMMRTPKNPVNKEIIIQLGTLYGLCML